MSAVRLVHGIHTNPKSRRLRDMAEHIEAGAEMPVEYFEYGHIYAVQTRFVNPGIAERLCDMVEPGDVLVGHSNGACIAMRALWMNAPALGLVCLNAALKDNIEVPRQLYWMHVYFNRHDEAVPWAAWSPHILTDPLWGDMGDDGYLGKDLRVRQWNCDAKRDGLPDLRGHSSIIDPANSKAWGMFIGRQIKAAMKGLK